MDQLPRVGKRELMCLLLFTCNYVVSFGEASYSSGCLGWATFLALPEPSIKLFWVGAFLSVTGKLTFNLCFYFISDFQCCCLAVQGSATVTLHDDLSSLCI